MKACYRYRTVVLHGPWRRSPERAIEDAIAARQARRGNGAGIEWDVSGTIQESICAPDNACRGSYPPPD